MLGRAVVTWVLMIPVAVANGIFREKVLRRWAGERTARQVSVATGSAGMFGVVYALWHRDAQQFEDRELARMGGVWVVATVLFELTLGRAQGMSLKEMLRDYNILAGRFWPFVLLAIAMSPITVKRMVTR